MENDLKFTGDAPLIIDFNGSTDDIYAPVVTTSYDVNVVSENILDDLYTAEKDDIAVKITESKAYYRTEATISRRGAFSLKYFNVSSDDEYIITRNECLFSDINGEVYFHGELSNANEYFDANIRFDYQTGTWTYLQDNEGWKMAEFEEFGIGWQYFTDGENSYKVRFLMNGEPPARNYYILWDDSTNNWIPETHDYLKYDSNHK